MWLRFTLFFLGLALAMAGLNVYVYRRARRAFALRRGGRRALIALLVAGALGLVVGRAFGAALGPALAAGLAVFGSTVQLAVIISAGFLLLVDLGRGLYGLAARLLQKRTAGPEGGDPTHAPHGPAPDPIGSIRAMGRRAFATRSAFGVPLLIGPGTSLYGALVGRHDYRIDEVPVRLPGLSPHLTGYSIVQLSDIHFGTFVDDPELDAAAELVRRARADLIVLTGDLIDHDPRYAPMLGRLVRRLMPLARDGVTAVAGNHDYYAGIDTTLGTLRSAGAKVLVNQGRVVGDRGGAFALLGVDDVWAPRYDLGRGPDLEGALSMVPPDLPRVLLCHNPVFFPEAAPRVQLQLSGHTHGGQVNVGVQLAHLVLPYGYVAGRYERDGSQLYVNRGFGTAGPPARIGAPPEVTRIVLTG
jgi:uncharacterized protein